MSKEIGRGDYMEKFERHLINWLLIGFFLIIDLALIPLMFIYFWPEQAPYIGDIFTWTGAIIGGTLTLVGVRLTLTRQADEKFLNDFPRKIKLLYEMQDVFDNMLNMCSHEIDLINNGERSALKLDLSRYLSKLIDLSSNIDGEVFGLINALKFNIKSFDESADTLVKVDDYGQPLILKEDISYYRFLLELLKKNINSISNHVDNHRVKQANRFYKLNK